MIFTLFEDFLNEGVNDPGILKGFFMAGGPGSGKSYVATELFGFPKGATSSVSYATGLKLVNNDNAFEKAIKDAGYDIGKIAQYAKDPEVWSKVMSIRDKAKNLTRKMQNNYIAGRLGQVIDGTGKDYKKIQGMRKLYQDLGYDTYMVFVNTSLEVALERNRNRARKLDDDMVEEMWQAVQDNLGKFQKLFGADKMIIVDNSSYDNEGILDQIEKAIMKRINEPIANPLGKRWIQDNSPAGRMKNQPFGVKRKVRESFEELNEAENMRTLRGFLKAMKKEYGPTPTEQSLADFIYNNYTAITGEDVEDSNAAANDHIADIIAHFKMDGEDFMIAWEDRMNESFLNKAVKVTAKMPASMKKWIMGEVKSHPNNWSNELTDLTNSIVSIHREMDLDLIKSDAGPEWIDIRETPVSELTTNCVEKINEIWPEMGEWAKEYIYSDYQHWFKVPKKDRPHYGILESVNERKASMVGREYEPDYKELMDLLDMAKEYADDNLFRGKDFILYWADDRVMFDNPNGAAVGYDKRDVRKKDVFPGKSEAVRTFKKANYSPELTKKEVEKRSKGKISVEMAMWQGEVVGVNYKFN